MKRMLVAGTVTILGLSGGLVPAAAQIPSSPAVVRENVRHLKNVAGTTGGHVSVEGDRLYMGNYGLGFTIYDIKDPRNPILLGQYRPQGPRADAVPDAGVFDGRHIVAFGGTSRVSGVTNITEFVDVTDPANPRLLHTIAPPLGEAHNADLVDERRLFLPSGSATPNFRIFDINPVLQQPAQAPTLIFGGDLRSLWNNSPFRRNRTVGPTFTHIHDISVYTDLSVLLPEAEWVDQDGDEIPDPTYAPKDIALIAEGGSYLGSGNTGSMFVVDITDPRAPVVRNRFLHATAAGHHPWRYFHEAQLLDGDPHIGFISDEDLHNGCNAGGVMSVRFSDDYTETTELDEWFIGQGTPAAVCSAHVFSSNGSYVFMGSYNAGLQIIDFTDPADLKRGGQYIAEGANSWGALYHEGVVYTGDFGGRGLDVFEFIPKPDAKAFLKVGNPSSRLAAVGGGVSELLGACDPEAATNDIDGMLVQIPPSMRDGTHKLRAMGSSAAPYDVDAYFWDENCSYISGILETIPEMTGDLQGAIPEGAAFAYVDLFAGAPQWVYAKLS